MNLPRSGFTKIYTAAMAFLTVAVPAFAGAQAPNSQADQSNSKVRNVHDYALINSRIVTVKGLVRRNNSVQSGPDIGKALPDTCDLQLSLAPGERAIEARGIPSITPRLNQDGTCEVEMELGQPPDSALPAYNQAPPRSDLSPRPASLTPSPGTSSGYMQGYYYDPVGIWVNSEQVNISWIWTNSPIGCAALYSYSTGVPSSFPGWYTVSLSRYTINYCAANPPYGFTTTAEGAGLYANWQDNSWPGCLGSPANAYYDPIYAYGNNSGSLYGDFSWVLTGPGVGCIDLLTPSYNLVRTYN